MNQEEYLKLIYKVFDPSMPRLGPGEFRSTEKAWQIIWDHLPAKKKARLSELRILDIGCGNGAQTIDLAKIVPDAAIIALDNHPPYLKELERRAEAEGFSDRIRTSLQDMSKMNFDPESFDVIWSESSIFCMGFRHGLDVCRELLADGGFIAVSEMCWLKADPPDEIRRYFDQVYPDIMDIESNLSAVRSAGLKPVDNFILPVAAWLEEFYAPLEERLCSIRAGGLFEKNEIEAVEEFQKEIDLYRKYSDCYGYEFLIMRR